MTRIVELFSGKIEIDDVDISKVGIARLRNEITVIPQDPVMFAGTLRYNLDPFSESTDERMKALIKKAGLEYLLAGVSKKELEDKDEKEAKDKAQKKLLLQEGTVEGSGDEKKTNEGSLGAKETVKGGKKNAEDEEEVDGKGLKFKVQDEGMNLSVGERQLICIIRAILRRNKIIILDEATANIDVVTEQAIQKLLDEEFRGATVLCIAHRLNTIIKSDKVLVMDQGKLVEYASPQLLIQDKSSVFSHMLEQVQKRADDFF